MRAQSKRKFVTAIEDEQRICSHGIEFDLEAAKGLSSDEVKKRWPRGWFTEEKPCPHGCGFVGITYATYEHYIAGDW